MSDLKSEFESAYKNVKNLSKRPENDTLLDLYAFYKQASQGDVTGKRPGFTDFKGRAKYDAWSKIKGTPQEHAMQSYVDLVGKLQKTNG